MYKIASDKRQTTLHRGRLKDWVGSEATMANTVKLAETYFHKCVKEWNEADRHCQRTYAIWHDAVERRVRLVIAKNNAWGELEMAKAAANAKKRKRR